MFLLTILAACQKDSKANLNNTVSLSGGSKTYWIQSYMGKPVRGGEEGGGRWINADSAH